MKRWGTTSAKGGYDGETWGRWWAWSQGKEHGTNGYGGRSWEVMSMDMDIYAYGGYTWALGGVTSIPWNGFTKRISPFS